MKRRFVRELFFILWIQVLVAGPYQAMAEVDFLDLLDKDQVKPTAVLKEKNAMLKRSQISYRAEGGFSGIISYGVIISCVNGKISVLKSITDPRLTNKSERIRETSNMTEKEYLALCDKLNRYNAMHIEDAPKPRLEILAEFTHVFDMSIGDKRNAFKVFGINRPEASRHFAVKSIIDHAAHMDSTWNSHSSLALVEK